jgi:hypothetical protein
MIRGLDIYDIYIIIPSMFGLIITGLIYAIFTEWGFKKYYWIMIKWLMIITFVYLGSNVSDSIFSELHGIVSKDGFSKNDPDFLATLLNAQILYGIIIFLFVTVVALSIFKPFGKTFWQKKP